jgi:hypothetical protein
MIIFLARIINHHATSIYFDILLRSGAGRRRAAAVCCFRAESQLCHSARRRPPCLDAGPGGSDLEKGRLAIPVNRTEVKAFWTDTDLYVLFRCPYTTLNLFLPAGNQQPRVGLWDRDVVEMFLGDDWTNIRHYREFEIAPTGDWIDLAIDLDRNSYDHNWRSGWQTMARIEGAKEIWLAAARIPLSAVSAKPVQDGTKWRMNLYRIEGQGADPQRHFLCWQPTCVQNRDPNHVPEHFGTLVFSGKGS